MYFSFYTETMKDTTGPGSIEIYFILYLNLKYFLYICSVGREGPNCTDIEIKQTEQKKLKFSKDKKLQIH